MSSTKFSPFAKYSGDEEEDQRMPLSLILVLLIPHLDELEVPLHVALQM